MSIDPENARKPISRREFVDTFISIILSKNKGGRGHRNRYIYENIERGFREVLEGSSSRDIYDYDFQDPMSKQTNNNEADQINSAVETLLSPRLDDQSEWTSGEHRADQLHEFRVTTYNTNLPEIRLVTVEYRYPNKPEWGISIRRTIQRV